MNMNHTFSMNEQKTVNYRTHHGSDRLINVRVDIGELLFKFDVDFCALTKSKSWHWLRQEIDGHQEGS